VSWKEGKKELCSGDGLGNKRNEGTERSGVHV